MAFSLKQEISRKLIHLSSFWIVGMIYFVPRTWCIVVLSLLSAFVLISEYEVYKRTASFFARTYKFLFSRILREQEKDISFHYSGAPYVLIASLILVIVMQKPVAMFSLCVLLLSDTMAALVGRSIGQHKLIGKKTWEGTIAFLCTGFLICLLFEWSFGLPIHLLFLGVCLGCLGDLFNCHIHIDDNLSIPILTALPFLF